MTQSSLKSHNRPSPVGRDAFAVWRSLPLRWNDTDVYGHVNNAVHHQLFDTAVNGHLVDAGVLDPARSPGVFLVVSNGCDYFSELRFPGPVEAGLRVDHLGRSSVTYAIGLFAPNQPACAALGRFVHVLVGREDRRPMAMGDRLAAALARLRLG
ncbi:MAG: acyl-CoA thioesterase [Primorskyibacter sp.]